MRHCKRTEAVTEGRRVVCLPRVFVGLANPRTLLLGSVCSTTSNLRRCLLWEVAGLTADAVSVVSLVPQIILFRLSPL